MNSNQKVRCCKTAWARFPTWAIIYWYNRILNTLYIENNLTSCYFSRPLEDSERLPVRTHRVISPQSEKKEEDQPEDVSYKISPPLPFSLPSRSSCLAFYQKMTVNTSQHKRQSWYNGRINPLSTNVSLWYLTPASTRRLLLNVEVFVKKLRTHWSSTNSCSKGTTSFFQTQSPTEKDSCYPVSTVLNTN